MTDLTKFPTLIPGTRLYRHGAGCGFDPEGEGDCECGLDIGLLLAAELNDE